MRNRRIIGTLFALLWLAPATSSATLQFSQHYAGGEPYLLRCDGQPKRMLLYLHTWTGNQRQVLSYPELGGLRDYCVVSPEFGGPNSTARALGSRDSTKRIARVVSDVRRKTGIDQVDIVAASGGTLAALLYMGRHPGGVRKAWLWVPIYDLALLYQGTANESLKSDMRRVLGSPPGSLDDPRYAHRSPRPVLQRVRGPLHVVLNVGRWDTTTPPEHGHLLATALRRRPEVTAELVEHAMGHEFPIQHAIEQIRLE